MEQLTDWVFTELEEKDSLFNVPTSGFFVPSSDDPFRVEKYGVEMDTPFGVAAGPHSQMAQNIIVSWLVGGRFLELKTIQTLDELDISKPCIEVEDEGYNVEWSQELKVYQSFDEYLRAWVLIHALHDKFGWHGDTPGMIFNMSVGYNLEGMLQPNVQWFFDVMADASEYIPAYVDIVAERYPAIRDIEISNRLSDSITLSTMHGCPPDEIEKICSYLLEERRLNTSVKLNPTLLGADRVRRIVNDDLGFDDIPIPDEAFGHDLMYDDAVPMLHSLRRLAGTLNLTFGVKLTNTLEVNNWRDTFADDDMMYLSGRSLLPVTVNLASKLREDFGDKLLMSFAGGADCFNVAGLMRSGMTSVTVCSDLLKTGGYLRMLQYTENLANEMADVGAANLQEYTIKTGLAQPSATSFPEVLRYGVLTNTGLELTLSDAVSLGESLAGMNGASATASVFDWAAQTGMDAVRADSLIDAVTEATARINLRQLSNDVREDWRYQKQSFRTDHSKTPRKLGHFDCIEAPCLDECPVDQKVPQYMNAVRDGRFLDAVALTREDNPIPSILGRVCDHLCENTCVRTHLDEPLAIRQMKRFIMDQESQPVLLVPNPKTRTKVAIIGAGPAGISAAQELAYTGFKVTVFEEHPYAGGMVGGTIPTYRLPQHEIDADMAILDQLGVEIRYGQKAGVDFTLSQLRAEGYNSVFIAVGAQLAKKLDLEGEEAKGILDGITFLRSVREGHPISVGPRVGVIGAGDTAMDCVRSAARVGASEVSLIYRRTTDQMPADPEEIRASIEEGVNIIELAKPIGLNIGSGVLKGLVCVRNEYRGERDSSKRKVPFEIPNSEFEIELDTLLLAISQHSILDFFGDDVPELNRWGYIAVDPETFESSVPNVYAGGDVAADGPSSIVKAAADGKLVAATIAEAQGLTRVLPKQEDRPVDLADMMLRRGRRQYRTPIEHTPLDQRHGFDETVLGYTVTQAQEEAGRCLDCHEVCSLCVGVCPNMALLTYESDSIRAQIPEVSVSPHGVEIVGATRFVAGQAFQIAVLSDFCNECGNCVTACPTSGQPYFDKPRLYLNREEFEAETDNAFMMFSDTSIESRVGGETHRVVLNGSIEYTTPSLTARLDSNTLELIEATAKDDAAGATVSLMPAATMFTVLKGLRDSMPHIPVMAAEDASGTLIGHPGYLE